VQATYDSDVTVWPAAISPKSFGACLDLGHSDATSAEPARFQLYGICHVHRHEYQSGGVLSDVLRLSLDAIARGFEFVTDGWGSNTASFNAGIATLIEAQNGQLGDELEREPGRLQSCGVVPGRKPYLLIQHNSL
jgi:hypothetical protein